MQSLLWAANNLYISAPVLIILIFILREILFAHAKKFYAVYYSLLFPGVVLHETSHMIACLLVGAKITDVEFFSKTGGHVAHMKPKLKYVGTFIISLFPLITGSAIIILLLPYLNLSHFNIQTVLIDIIIFYLLTTVTITMFPSSKDFSNAWFLYIIVIAGLLLVSYFLRVPTRYTSEIIYFLLACVGILTVAWIILYLLGNPFKKH